MRRLARFSLFPLLLFGLQAAAEDAETFVDETTGLTVAIPDGWNRDARREKGGVRFAATYSVGDKKTVLFEVEAGSAAGFQESAWLDASEKQAAQVFQSPTEPFRKEDGVRVGGLQATAYAIAGKPSGKPYTIRYRVRAVVNGDNFFVCREVSYNGAHEECADELAAMWNGVAFQAAEPGGLGGTDAPAGGPTSVEDKEGNFKLTLPPGWEVTQEPPQGPEDTVRLIATRRNANGDILLQLVIFRWESDQAQIFNAETPGDVLINWFQKGGRPIMGHSGVRGFFEIFYGEGSATLVQPQIDSGVLLGDLEKSCAYKYSSTTLEEQEKIREAQTLRRRGDKSVKVPEFKPLVVRGRVGLLSPYIYIVRAAFPVRSLADDPKLLAEYKKVMDSWEFLQSAALPAPLTLGDLKIGNTKDDPAFAKERDEEFLYTEKARRTYQLELRFTLPPGFQWVKEAAGGNTSLVIVAQDGKNNWVQIIVAHSNANRLGEERKKWPPKKQTFSGWRENWLAKARGARMKERPGRVRIGRTSGKGWELVEGKVEKFRATKTIFMFDKSGWRTIVDMETRGRGDKVFEEQIENFFKSLRLKKQ